MILESMQDQGLALQDDMFTSGNNPHGCGHVPRTHYKGDRTTSANYFHKKGPNLAIKTETMVDKVILAGEGDNLRAVAVKVIEGDHNQWRSVLLTNYPHEIGSWSKIRASFTWN
jgi:hypothetical protein